MAKTQMIKYSTSLTIKAMEIKSTVRFHLTLKIAIIKNTNSKCWQGYWAKGTLIHC
jgi:hypothetical protein